MNSLVDAPKLLLVSENTLAPASVECPPNSVEVRVDNFRLTRVTMDPMQETIQDAEDLKCNHAQPHWAHHCQSHDRSPANDRAKNTTSDRPGARRVQRLAPALAPARPLAQTFSLIRNRVVSAVGVQFARKDPFIPVTVQIRGVTAGLPNEVMLAEKVISPDEMILDGETKIAFGDPFYAEANNSYAVVLLTNSTEYRLRIVPLWQQRQNGVNTRPILRQDVLVESSNAETWMPLNSSDLTLKIYGYDFQASGEVRFQPVTSAEFNEFNLDEYSAIPEGTRIAREYSTHGGTPGTRSRPPLRNAG